MSFWAPAYERWATRRIKPCPVMTDEAFDRFLAPVMAQVMLIPWPANDRDGKRW